MLLSIAVSIDALAVGMRLGLVGVSVGLPALLIGVTAAVRSLAGLRLGFTAGRMLGQPVELVAGIVLIGTGLRILSQHVML